MMEPGNGVTSENVQYKYQLRKHASRGTLEIKMKNLYYTTDGACFFESQVFTIANYELQLKLYFHTAETRPLTRIINKRQISKEELLSSCCIWFKRPERTLSAGLTLLSDGDPLVHFSASVLRVSMSRRETTQVWPYPQISGNGSLLDGLAEKASMRMNRTDRLELVDFEGATVLQTSSDFVADGWVTFIVEINIMQEATNTRKNITSPVDTTPVKIEILQEKEFAVTVNTNLAYGIAPPQQKEAMTLTSNLIIHDFRRNVSEAYGISLEELRLWYCVRDGQRLRFLRFLDPTCSDRRLGDFDKGSAAPRRGTSTPFSLLTSMDWKSLGGDVWLTFYLDRYVSDSEQVNTKSLVVFLKYFDPEARSMSYVTKSFVQAGTDCALIYDKILAAQCVPAGMPFCLYIERGDKQIASLDVSGKLLKDGDALDAVLVIFPCVGKTSRSAESMRTELECAYRGIEAPGSSGQRPSTQTEQLSPQVSHTERLEKIKSSSPPDETATRKAT